MDFQAILKAGGVGTAVLVVLSLLGFIPCVGCITFVLAFLVYAGIGILAAHWMTMPRNASSGAINGAIATAAAALVAGFVGLIIQGIYVSVTGVDPFAAALADVPPDQLMALYDAGIDPAMFAGMGVAGVLGIGTLCCGLWAVIAAAFGAAGGAYWGSSHQS